MVKPDKRPLLGNRGTTGFVHRDRSIDENASVSMFNSLSSVEDCKTKIDLKRNTNFCFLISAFADFHRYFKSFFSNIPGFESQSHRLCFFILLFVIDVLKITKIGNKRKFLAGVWF